MIMFQLLYKPVQFSSVISRLNFSHAPHTSVRFTVTLLTEIRLPRDRVELIQVHLKKIKNRFIFSCSLFQKVKRSYILDSLHVSHRGSLLKGGAVQGVLYQSILNAMLTGRKKLGRKMCTSNSDDQEQSNLGFHYT